MSDPAVPIVEHDSRGASERRLSVEQWLTERVAGRVSTIEDAIQTLALTGEFRFYRSSRSWTLSDPAAFKRDLSALRASRPELFEAAVPDHWLGEY